MKAVTLLTLVAVVGAGPAAALAGEVEFGKMLGMTKKCHVVRFKGPKEAVADYEKRQRERFETVDQAFLSTLQTSVSVSVTMEAPRERTFCYAGSDKPERLVFTEKAAREPVLAIPLTLKESSAKNLAGAEFAIFEGFGTVPAGDIERLANRALDLHVIFTGGVEKESWKKDYAAKILK